MFDTQAIDKGLFRGAIGLTTTRKLSLLAVPVRDGTSVCSSTGRVLALYASGCRFESCHTEWLVPSCYCLWVYARCRIEVAGNGLSDCNIEVVNNDGTNANCWDCR